MHKQYLVAQGELSHLDDRIPLRFVPEDAYRGRARGAALRLEILAEMISTDLVSKAMSALARPRGGVSARSACRD